MSNGALSISSESVHQNTKAAAAACYGEGRNGIAEEHAERGRGSRRQNQSRSLRLIIDSVASGYRYGSARSRIAIQRTGCGGSRCAPQTRWIERNWGGKASVPPARLGNSLKNPLVILFRSVVSDERSSGDDCHFLVGMAVFLLNGLSKPNGGSLSCLL